MCWLMGRRGGVGCSLLLSIDLGSLYRVGVVMGL